MKQSVRQPSPRKIGKARSQRVTTASRTMKQNRAATYREPTERQRLELARIIASQTRKPQGGAAPTTAKAQRKLESVRLAAKPARPSRSAAAKASPAERPSPPAVAKAARPPRPASVVATAPASITTTPGIASLPRRDTIAETTTSVTATPERRPILVAALGTELALSMTSTPESTPAAGAVPAIGAASITSTPESKGAFLKYPQTRVAASETATPRRRPLPERPAPPSSLPPDPDVSAPEQPTGFTEAGQGPRRYKGTEFVPIPDRWRIGFPDYDRYPNDDHEAMAVRGRWWDPYKQNVLKGDYPLPGFQNTFFLFTLRNDTLIEGRRLPVPKDVSSARPRSQEFFGEGESLSVEDNVLMSFELFGGNAAFRPRKWELRATPVFNANYLTARENGVVNIDPRRGTDRFDGHVAFQELFADYELAEISPYFDTVNLRVGIQPFISDFRGFLFTDAAPGVKLSGNYHANRTQWNLAYFRPLDKDTNTGLNTLFRDREQDVAIANLTRQDFIFPGYFTQLSLHYNFDHASTHYDENGFLVRPAAIGDATPHNIRVGYGGWTGDGHVDRINISHAFFQAFGHDSHNPIAGRETDINAQMAALELSYDRDWLRFKGSFFYASGDADATDGTATGFDAITDNPFFVGGPASFWQRQGIKLTGTNVNLVNRFSLLPTLRSSKDEGQANFVNPGIFIYNLGVAGRLTPKLAFEANVNYLRFDEVSSVQTALLQRTVPHEVGLDYGVVLKYRPLLIDNIIIVGGAAAFTPLAGFRSIYTSETLFQAFGGLTLTY